MEGLGSSSVGKALGWWQAASWMWAHGVPWQSRRPTAPVCMNRGMAHRPRERIIPLYMALIKPYLDTALSFGPWKDGQTRGTFWNVPKAVGAGALGVWAEAGGAGLVQPGEETASGNLTDTQCLRSVIEEVELGSSQSWGVGKWDTNVHKWNKRVSDWIQGKAFPPWGQSDSGAGCPERLHSLPPWRFSKPSWGNTWAAWSDPIAHPCFEQEVGLGHLP